MQRVTYLICLSLGLTGLSAFTQASGKQHSPATRAQPYVYCALIDDRHRTVYQSGIFLQLSLMEGTANDFSIALSKRFPVVIGTGKCFSAKDASSALNGQTTFRSQWQWTYKIVDTGWNPDSREIDVPRLLAPANH